MEITKATCQYSKLENGSHNFEVHGQSHNYFIKGSFSWCPQNIVLSFSPKMLHQCLDLQRKSLNESGVSISYLPNPSSPPYYNITNPTTTPQHRMVLDSSTLNQRGFLEFSIQSFGTKPSQSLLAFFEYTKIFS